MNFSKLKKLAIGELVDIAQKM
ncbi:MAG: hypothetical protein QG556_81, partial [Pseudomonadota bacterium]|nr:hypothetical protein [Pseudomonadota bacterium]